MSNEEKSKKGYQWRFFRSGGFDQVRIETADDLRHLGELDQKLWSVLACPTSGLEFDSLTASLTTTCLCSTAPERTASAAPTSRASTVPSATATPASSTRPAAVPMSWPRSAVPDPRRLPLPTSADLGQGLMSAGPG